MKKIALAMMMLALAVSCNTGSKSDVQKKADEYALVKIATPDLSGITDNGKEVLNLYKFAADQADSIYWQQSFGDRSVIESLNDEDLKEFARINYGPWNRVDGEPFIEGYGHQPAGANFYPADMTSAEFEALQNPAKNSPYTLIRRNSEGGLEAVWFHDAYKRNIDKICNYLTAAADITIKESVRDYLLSKVEALRTDYYYDSDCAWLDMTDSKMDLIIGPNEINDDHLYGMKRSYEAYVLLKDLKRTEVVNNFSNMLEDFQKALPCEDQYKNFVPGKDSDIYTYDAIYCSGHANAGIKLMALNLPYDPKVQAEKGTRTALLHNVIVEKFNRLVSPVGMVVFEADDQATLDAETFYWNVVFREIAHSLGVKQTINGKGPVYEAMGNKNLTWEDAKANVVGLYLFCKMIDEHKIPGLVSKSSAINTFVANLIRSQRFGEESLLGRAYVMVFNYLNEQGAFTRGASGKYSINQEKLLEATAELAGIILKTQATGDYEFASEFEKKYCSLSDNFKADLTNIRLENIPVDIKFEFQK
ncbi:MAG: Zn-dependent hydrolase [Bacteroidales bacterium]|nr:Zn-dependent hydrolase [Bacteroidales bacterium]